MNNIKEIDATHLFQIYTNFTFLFNPTIDAILTHKKCLPEIFLFVVITKPELQTDEWKCKVPASNYITIVELDHKLHRAQAALTISNIVNNIISDKFI